jgi:hypothetical protein
MWLKSLGSIGCALALLSCGAAPPPAPKPAPAPVASAPAPVAPREASTELRRYWIFDGHEAFALYGGLDALMHTELFAGLVPGVLNESEDFLKSTQRDCVGVLTAQAHEVAVGADARGALMILELGPEGVKAARAVCVGALFPVERVPVAGADEAYAVGSDVVVVQSGVVLFGAKELVEAALAAKEPAPFPAALSLKDGQQMACQVRVAEKGVSGGGALRVSPEAFRLEAELELANAGMADLAARGIQQGLGQATQLAQTQPDIGRLAKALKVERHGNHFTAVFELREAVIDQARDVGVLMGLGFYGVRRYMQDAKSAEAPAVIVQIAKLYSATMQEPPPAGKRPLPKKLMSLPAVPAVVPRGVKYQSTAEDWKAWAPIHFSLTEPQYYQYEVVAAKDGKTAEILARGDLNGDGKTSLFRVKIALDPKTGEITAVDHSEEQPLE